MTSTARTLRLVMRHEWRMLIADCSLFLVLGLLALLIGYGFYNGLAETRARDAMVATVLKAEREIGAANLDTLRKIEAGKLKPGPFDNPANPATMGNGSGRHAVIPSLPLAPTAIGQSDMMPNYYKIGIRSKVEFMYDSEIESPWNLLSGHFDLSFVIVFLLPLLIFALTFNLLSSEREAGTQRMLLSQPLGIGTLALGKLIPRALSLLLTATALPILLLLIFRPEARSFEQVMPVLSWAAIVVGYGGFWFALAFAVNALRLSSATNSLVLIATWTLLVLVVPVLLNLVAEAVSPAPSRTQLSIRTRAIEADNLRRYDDLFSGDYRYIAEPDTLIAKNGRIEIPARTRASFLAKRDLDKRIDVVLDEFDASLLDQQRVVDRLSFLSPSILAYEGMTALAGNDGGRYLAFRQSVSAFHDGWRRFFAPRILRGIVFGQDDLAKLPTWHWNEHSPSSADHDARQRISLLLLSLVFVGGLGGYALRRYAIT